MIPRQLKIYLWVSEFRTSHWVKNTFVFAPILFNESFFDWQKLLPVCIAFLSLCFLASGIYIINDIIDREKDRFHPTKKNRPIASGKLEVKQAVFVSVFLLLFGIAVSIAINTRTSFLGILYITNNLAYCFLLKEKVIADVISISIGFMIRFMIGSSAADIDLSRWFLMCSFSLALFLAVGKRRTEFQELHIHARKTRKVFESYSKEKLNASLALTGALTTITYMLFSTSSETISLHDTNLLIFTIPVVVYVILRYMFKVIEGSGSGPVEILLRDKAFIIAGVVWVLMIMTILYVI